MPGAGSKLDSEKATVDANLMDTTAKVGAEMDWRTWRPALPAPWTWCGQRRGSKLRYVPPEGRAAPARTHGRAGGPDYGADAGPARLPA